MITQYSNFKYGNTQVSKIYQGETLIWPPTPSYVYYTPTPIDLGLSVKWASFNLGASRPEEFGYSYAWGEVNPKSTFTWGNYKWCQGTNTTLTKYNNNSSYGTVDNKTTLDLTDDAARVNLGGTWRIPTREEWQELVNNCTWTWEGDSGWSAGFRVTSNVSGYTNKSIFLVSEVYTDVRPGRIGELWASNMPTSQSYSRSAYRLRYRHQLIPDEYGNTSWVDGKETNYSQKAYGYYDNYNYVGYGAGIRPVMPK